MLFENGQHSSCLQLVKHHADICCSDLGTLAGTCCCWAVLLWHLLMMAGHGRSDVPDAGLRTAQALHNKRLFRKSVGCSDLGTLATTCCYWALLLWHVLMILMFQMMLKNSSTNVAGATLQQTCRRFSTITMGVTVLHIMNHSMFWFRTLLTLLCVGRDGRTSCRVRCCYRHL